jgi:hypothetical protein
MTAYFLFFSDSGLQKPNHVTKGAFGILSSMNPKSVLLHHKWKTGKKGMLLLCENNQPVLDMDGNPISCVGTWILLENMEQCQSAIATLHKAIYMIGAYQKPCID